MTFSDEVHIIGDGTESVVTIAGDKLSNFDQVFSIGSEHKLRKSIGESHADLSRKLLDLEEQGCTALGPALLASLAICSSSPSSKIIIATDGLSNVGVGSMDGLDTDEKKEEAERFYEKIGRLASQNGVNVSVLR